MKKNDLLKIQQKDKERRAFYTMANMDNFLIDVLKNFAHRYLSCENPSITHLESHSFTIRKEETNMKTVASSTRLQIKKGVGFLLRKTPLKTRPAIQYSITVKTLNIDNNGKGEMKVSACVNWDYPSFNESSLQYSEKKIFPFDDLIHLRNRLPVELEQVCDIF